MERLDHVQLFAGTHKLDGLAGGRPDRECRAAAGVAVQLGQQHAVDAQRLVKRLGGVDRVLTGHGVHHQQDLVGLHRGLDGLQLVHQRLVDVEPSGGIQKHYVVAVVGRVLDGFLCDGHGVDLPHLEHRDVQLLAHHLQLGDGGGTVHVAGGQQRALAVLPAHQTRQLGAVGGLTGALQAHHHHNGGALGRGGQTGVSAAHQRRQLLIDDLDDLLGGGQAVQHVRAHALLGDGRHKVLDDLVADVGLQQCQTHLAHTLPDVRLGETALAPEALEGRIQFFAQSLKCHGLLLQYAGSGDDAVGQLLQPVVFILPVVDGLDLVGGSHDGVHAALHPHKALEQAGLVLQLVHGGLGADDHVPHTLPGDAAVLGDLRQRQILVVVEVKQLALPVGEDVTVKIEQHGHAVGLVFHGLSSFCKVIRLYNSEYLTRYRPKSQDEMWRRLKIFQKKETAVPSLFRVRRCSR